MDFLKALLFGAQAIQHVSFPLSPCGHLVPAAFSYETFGLVFQHVRCRELMCTQIAGICSINSFHTIHFCDDASRLKVLRDGE